MVVWIIADSGTMFLVSEDSIHCIPSLTPLSIDFENNEEAIEFLETQLDERAT